MKTVNTALALISFFAPVIGSAANVPEEKCYLLAGQQLGFCISDSSRDNPSPRSVQIRFQKRLDGVVRWAESPYILLSESKSATLNTSHYVHAAPIGYLENMTPAQSSMAREKSPIRFNGVVEPESGFEVGHVMIGKASYRYTPSSSQNAWTGGAY